MKSGFPPPRSPSPWKQEKGAALLQSLFAVGMIGLFVGSALQHLQTQNRIHKFQQEKGMRAEIGNQLAAHLNNPEILFFSANFSAGTGNSALLPCTALDTATLSTCNQASFPDEGLEFLLVPPLSYTYPVDKGKKQNANCPNSDRGDISCFLAGKRGSARVGYSTQGYVGTLGPDFPLEAKAFFMPYCPTEDSFGNPIPPPPDGKSCAFPKGINVRYELVHHLFEGGQDTGKLGYMGVYPPKIQWKTLPATLLHGQSCNVGANIQGVDFKGFITCACNKPYRPTGQRNSNGPICEVEKETCPFGTLLKGNRADGSAICQTEAQDTQEWTNTLVFTSTAVAPGSSADCNLLNNGNAVVGGWVKSINQRCDTSYTIVQHEVDSFIWEYIAGLAGGGAAGVALGLVYLAMLSNPGTLAVLAIIVIAAALGTFLSWLFAGSPTTTTLVEGDDPFDVNNGPDTTPSIRCQVEVVCRAFN